LILAIIFAVFNVLVFVIPFNWDGTFWVAYVFAAVTIIGQAVADLVAFGKADTLKKVFYGVPIVKVAYSCLCAQLAVCVGLMAISLMAQIPAWVAVVPCTLILAFAAIAITKADWGRTIIEKIDAKHVEESRFIYRLRADLESLIPRISDSALKKKIEKLSEEVRYSDPVSNADLAELEMEMQNKFASLKQAAISDGIN
jgi:hypothetical protein